MQTIKVPPTAVSSTLTPSTALPVAAESSRKWTGRRRPQFSARLNPLAARSDAAAKIGALSDEKREYYRAKLGMRRQEHEHRMKNLLLEEKLLTQRLQHGRED
jgi:hypothetical protein